jgi:hypothetical protein
MGTQSEQLERKAHQVRARLTETLEELRAGMTPGHVVDHILIKIWDAASAPRPDIRADWQKLKAAARALLRQ